MVSQSGSKFWPGFWGVVGVAMALLLAGTAHVDLGWPWYVALIFLLMVPAPALYALYFYRRKYPEKGMAQADGFQFKVVRGVSVGLWLLFAAGTVARLLWDWEYGLAVVSVLTYGIALQELRVAHVVQAMRDRAVEPSPDGASRSS